MTAVHALDEPWRDVVSRAGALQAELDTMGVRRPDKAPAKAKRGTSNGNSAGSAEDRRRRRAWLLETFRADVDVFSGERGGTSFWDKGGVLAAPLGEGDPACRCFRCGLLLTIDTLTVDRIIPGCQGGTYRRSNIRPECGDCASKRGGATRGKPKKNGSAVRTTKAG